VIVDTGVCPSVAGVVSTGAPSIEVAVGIESGETLRVSAVLGSPTEGCVASGLTGFGVPGTGRPVAGSTSPGAGANGFAGVWARVVSTTGATGVGAGDFLSKNDMVNRPAPASSESAANP
jgi:hypothetical protein